MLPTKQLTSLNRILFACLFILQLRVYLLILLFIYLHVIRLFPRLFMRHTNKIYLYSLIRFR